MEIPKPTQLEVSKALRQFFFLDQTYNLGIWRTEQSKAEWQHDLCVKRLYDDLKHITLELLAADHTVPYFYRVDFNGAPTMVRTVDSAEGVEAPVLPDMRTIADKRVIIGHHGKESQYRHLLLKKWGPAETLVKRGGDTYASEHAAKITGGRQAGSFHVAADARHRLVVTRTGPRYHFADDLDLKMTKVFMHPKFAPPGFQFYVGQRLTAIVVAVPKGFQARCIQAAP